MPDITMCKGDGCKLRKDCYRAMATPDPNRQSYFVSPPFDENHACEHFYALIETTRPKPKRKARR
jgi:hypothetical protein